MADVKISQLPSASVFTPASDVIPIVTGGVTSKATTSSFINSLLNDSTEKGIGIVPIAGNGILQIGSYISMKGIIEGTTVTASAPSSSINFDIVTQAVQYYTSNTTTNFTLNIRGNASLALNSIMQIGQCMTFALIVVNGTTGYYPNVVQIDGNVVTVKWAGGTAPTTGNTSATDAYTFTVIKTASATFTVLASQTKYA